MIEGHFWVGYQYMAKTTDEMLNKIDSKLDDVGDALSKVDKEVALQKAAFDEHIKQDEKMYEEFKRMNDILQSNTDSLKEHMHRTELLESLVQKMDARLSPVEIRHIEEEAIKKHRHVTLVKWAKIIGALVGLVGLLSALTPVLKLFIK
jgi:thiaminase